MFCCRYLCLSAAEFQEHIKGQGFLTKQVKIFIFIILFFWTLDLSLYLYRIVYYSIGNQHLNLADKLAKVRLGFANKSQNFNAGFVKPTLYNIFSYILFTDAIQPKVEMKWKTCYIFVRLFRGDELEAYKIKPFLFLFALGLLAATKTLFKRKGK